MCSKINMFWNSVTSALLVSFFFSFAFHFIGKQILWFYPSTYGLLLLFINFNVSICQNLFSFFILLHKRSDCCGLIKLRCVRQSSSFGHLHLRDKCYILDIFRCTLYINRICAMINKLLYVCVSHSINTNFQDRYLNENNQIKTMYWMLFSVHLTFVHLKMFQRNETETHKLCNKYLLRCIK